MFCRSRWLSSAVVFEALFGAVGADDDLCGAGIADFGVRGLVAAWRGSFPGLAEVEPALELWAVARQTPAATVTNKHTTLYFVILIVNLPPRVCRSSSPTIRARFRPEGCAPGNRSEVTRAGYLPDPGDGRSTRLHSVVTWKEWFGLSMLFLVRSVRMGGTICCGRAGASETHEPDHEHHRLKLPD